MLADTPSPGMGKFIVNKHTIVCMSINDHIVHFYVIVKDVILEL